MRVLLDTCTFLWWMAEPDKLSASVRRLLLDRRNEILLSAASGWEISLKWRLGRLQLRAEPAAFIAEAVSAHALAHLPVSMAHAVRAGDLPLHHKDPFDRMLIAQAEIESVALATPDAAFGRYRVETLW